MAVRYEKLWNILRERNMLKTDLIREAKITTNAMARLGKNEDVRVEVLAKICNTLGCTLQLRQRPMLSDMITLKLCDQISETQRRQYSFISKDIMDAWTTTGVLPTQRDIAKKYGRDETSVSRSVKDLINKLRKEVHIDGIK